MRQQLVTRQSQNLSLTPELKQSLRFLGLATNELVEELKDIALENPLIDLEDGTKSELETTGASTEAEIVSLEHSAYLKAEVPTDYTTHKMSSSGDNEFNYDGSNSEYVATRINFRDHLKEQLISNNTSDNDREFCAYLIDCVDEDGFLKESYEDLQPNFPIHKDWEFSDFERCRSILKNLDPTGVSSIDLVEHLHLQIEKTESSSIVKNISNTILVEHLNLLASFNYKKLAQTLGCELADAEEAAKLISHLSPKPISGEWGDHARYVKPDLIAEKFHTKWSIRLNHEHIPKIGVNQEYASLIQHEKTGEASPLKKYLKQARNIQRSINQRHETLLTVAREIFKVQFQFLENGPKGLIPLNLQAISEAAELHESTISRATSGKYISTPRGTFELKYFFSNAIGDMGDTSATHVKDVIKKMIKAEDPQKPLSDSKIQKLLSTTGIEIARRTVAKYRENQNILPSQLRKKI
jgi:RNA polymerase sigma-54 factor